jgi:molybdopterin synthase catalytic subunit
MIELLYEPLSAERCVEAVRRQDTGGIVTFVGTVREISEGKQVDFLEYEAYEPMAIAKMEQVVREASERWPVRGMAIQHRLGKLGVGEDAVVIAVSCPHRAEAFAACEYSIDRLKEIVPIWKKEHGEGGQIWVGGPTLQEPATSRDRAPD